MNNPTRLVPLAIGVALVGGLTWLLLDRDAALGTWLLAALLLGHGAGAPRLRRPDAGAGPDDGRRNGLAVRPRPIVAGHHGSAWTRASFAQRAWR